MKAPFMYFKADPTEYCRITVGGKVVRESKGVSKFIWPFKTTVELVSTSLMNQPYSFPEVTSDNQQVNVQGSFLYSAQVPDKVLNNFNCAIDPRAKDGSRDFHDISEQILNSIRGVAKQYIQKTSLEEMLKNSAVLAEEISTKVTDSPVIKDLGLRVQTVYVNQITPDPTIAKALGAVYREKLLTAENKATYDRRAEAVTQERQIKDNELSNAIDLENRRKELISIQEANAKAEGAYQAEVLKMGLDIYKDMDPDTLKAHALIMLGKNAQNVTTLAFGPSLLTSGDK